MRDFDQLWSNDLTPLGSGDISSVDGTEKGEQRVLRRLMTNPGDYMWHPTYGAGIPRFVGTVNTKLQIEAVIREQLAREATVAQTPVPAINIQPILNGVFVTIVWVDARTQERATLEFDVTT